MPDYTPATLKDFQNAASFIENFIGSPAREKFVEAVWRRVAIIASMGDWDCMFGKDED